MKSLNKMQSMFKSAKVPFKEREESGKIALVAELPRASGAISVVFSDKGEHFHSAKFTPKKDGKPIITCHHLTDTVEGYLFGCLSSVIEQDEKPKQLALTSESDLDTIFEMIEGSPNKEGEVFYAETEDGEICAAVYVPNDSALATFFICKTETGKFLGLMGAEVA